MATVSTELKMQSLFKMVRSSIMNNIGTFPDFFKLQIYCKIGILSVVKSILTESDQLFNN